MAIADNNVEFYPETGTLLSPSTHTWTELEGTTWANWNKWRSSATDLVFAFRKQDLGEVKTFNLNTTWTGQGIMTWKVYTSDTGLYAGEEVETVVAPNATNIPSFSGRYFIIQANITQDGSNYPLYSGGNVTTSSKGYDITLSGIDSSTLSGTVNGRLVSFDRVVGNISKMVITSRGSVTAYSPDVYVTNITTTDSTYATVTDMSPPTVKFTGMDGHNYDSIFDVTVTVLPEQYMTADYNIRER